MSGQNRMLAILLGVLAALVLVIGGVSTVLLLSGGDGGGTSLGVTTGDGDGGGAAGSAQRLRLAGIDPVGMDPHLTGDAGSAAFIVEVFGGLYTISPDLAIVPDLADGFPEISEDGLVYTFTLRDDIFFHSRERRRVTAEDVRWSIERAASAELASPQAHAYLGDIVGARESFFGLAEGVEGVRVIDDRTIEFTLREPIPPGLFLAKLTYPTAFVVDRFQIEGNERNWTRQPNGTGPYRLKEWRVGERIVLEANAAYHLGAPQVPEVWFELSGGSRLTRFENDELDVALISINDIERARDPNSSLNELYQTAPEFTVSYLALNTAVSPLDDLNVRRALALAIDRDTVAGITFLGMVQPATGILPPQLPGFTAEDKTLPFDPEAARAALAASTYADGDLPPITLFEVGGGASASIDTQAFLEQWRDVGITVEIRQADFATYLSEVGSGRVQMFGAGWVMDYPDPESILDLKFHSESQLNDVSYKNPEVDDLLDRARIEPDPQRRIDLYKQVEQLLIDNVVWIPLYFAQSHVVVNADVDGWFEPPIVLPRLRFVTVNR